MIAADLGANNAGTLAQRAGNVPLSGMMNHKALHQTATLLFCGAVISALTAYAPMPVAQFAGMVLIVVGLVGLFVVLDEESGKPGWSGRVGTATAVVALALYGVLQAGDGWERAPESMRWLEAGVRRYHSFMLGLAIAMSGVAIDRTPGIPRSLAFLMTACGIAYLVQGWRLTSHGLVGIVSLVVWSGWLLVIAWRQAAGARRRGSTT